jgi:excisionase family DNA binding protein
MEAQKSSPEALRPSKSADNNAPNDIALTLTVAEAAALAGVAKCTLYESIRRGEVPSIRIGRRLLIPRRALERMLSGDSGLK